EHPMDSSDEPPTASQPDPAASFADELLDEKSVVRPWNPDAASKSPSAPIAALARGGGAAVLVPAGTPGAVEVPRQTTPAAATFRPEACAGTMTRRALPSPRHIAPRPHRGRRSERRPGCRRSAATRAGPDDDPGDPEPPGERHPARRPRFSEVAS